MPRNRKNDDGSYSCFIYDSLSGKNLEVRIPAGSGADELDRFDRREFSKDYEYEHWKDMRVEKLKKFYESSESDYDIDPIAALIDKRTAVEDVTDPEEKKVESKAVIETRRIIETLVPQTKALYEKRYVEERSYEYIGSLEGVTKQAINNRDLKLRNRIKKALAEAGITEYPPQG